MHPGAWFAWALFTGLTVMFTTNPFYLLPVVAVCYLVYQACRLDGPQARSFRSFLIFGAITMCTRTALVLFTPGGPTREATAHALLEGLRLAVLLIVFGTFNSVSDPFRVLRLAPRRFHEPALAAALALSIAPRTIDAAVKVREAQRLRGLRSSGPRSWIALAVPVLETGMEEAVTLAESMDARGHGRGARTRYRPDTWTVASTVVSVGSILVFIAFMLAARAGNELLVSTYPLHWPSVSAALVVATFLLAVPVFFPEEGR